MEHVSVIGSGSWGTTLAKILADNGHRVMLWARSDEVVRAINQTHCNEAYLPGIKLSPLLTATVDLEAACQHGSLLLMSVPSHGLRQVARTMAPFLSGEHLMVHTTKGIEEGTFKRMSEILREETCVRRIGVLSGPNLAKELAVKQPAGTLIASRYREVFQRCQAVFHNHYFRVYSGDDVIGAEVGGAFKNVVAVAAGVIEGLKLGDNTKALLLTRGVNEMARLGVALGANVLTFSGMAGLGDLIATCASPFSRNHQVGQRLAQGQTLEAIQSEMRMVAEGVKTSKAIHYLGASLNLRLPIVDAVYALIHEGIPLIEVAERLMATRAGDEFEDLPS